MKKNLYFLIWGFVLLACSEVGAQNFSRVEYFFDNDPGFGSAQALTVPSGNDIQIDANINPGSISAGLHWLYIRARRGAGTGLDLQNRWTTTFAKPIMVYPHSSISTGNTGIVKTEYFWDTDPGYGNGTAMNLNGGSDITENVNFGAGSLPAGLHFLGVRVQIHQGQWSPTVYAPILVVSSFTTGNPTLLAAAEYFIDTDLGFGNNPQLAINNIGVANDISLSVPIPTNLPVGLHKLGVRTRTQRGQWSSTLEQPFVVLPTPNPEINVSRIEYYIDTDPGVGLATSMAFLPNPARDVTVNLNINVTGLALGAHTIYYRMRDSNNRWTIVYSMPFEIVTGPPCPENQTVNNSTSIVGGLVQASQTVVATNQLQAGSSIEYRAGKSVVLSPGFNTQNGTTFKVIIGGCN